MNKKFKYTSLVAAGAVTLGLVGGTLAWFTSQDSVSNPFSTAGDFDPNNPNAGIKVLEDFDEEGAKDLMPGKTVNKDVQVKNTEKYNQFIRVNLQVSIINNGQDGTTALEVYNIVKTSDGKYVLDGKEDLELEFTDHLGTAITVGNWIDGEDGYFYYIDNVSGGSHTNTLLNSVTLHSTAGNEYRGMNFNINVNAESVQASNDAVLDVWFSDVKDIEGEGTVLQSLKAKYAELQTSKTDSGLEDDEEIYESEDEDGKHIHKAPEETPGE